MISRTSALSFRDQVRRHYIHTRTKSWFAYEPPDVGAATLMSKKTRVPEERSKNADAAAQAMAPVLERLDLHGEMLARIIQLLTEEKASDGPSLFDLLADLIKRLDNQSAYLKDLTVAVAQLGINLPLDLIQAIDDTLGIPQRTDGHANGAHPA